MIMDYTTTPRSWKTMVGIKSYTQNKAEVKISNVRFFMRHPVFLGTIPLWLPQKIFLLLFHDVEFDNWMVNLGRQPYANCATMI